MADNNMNIELRLTTLAPTMVVNTKLYNFFHIFKARSAIFYLIIIVRNNLLIHTKIQTDASIKTICHADGRSRS